VRVSWQAAEVRVKPMVMNEIDFLPDWYKTGLKRQISYRTQCLALGCIFAVMVVWNFVCGQSVSEATAELTRNIERQADAISTSHEFTRVKNEAARLWKNADFIQEIDSKIDIAAVLGEMSFLIGRNVVLNRVEFVAEKFAHKQEIKVNSGSLVKVAGGSRGGKGLLPLGPARFKVVISGVASEASCVAELICRLEDSPYFCQVIPAYSRNKKMKAPTGGGGEDFQVSEFEIGCYLANYRQE